MIVVAILRRHTVVARAHHPDLIIHHERNGDKDKDTHMEVRNKTRVSVEASRHYGGVGA